MDTTSSKPVLSSKSITFDDVRAALSAGFADFRRAPAFGLFFGLIFSIVGIVIFLQLVVWGSSYWVLPIAAGFPLIGPFVAVGLYEVSRRIETGAPLDWAEILGVIKGEGRRQIPSLAFVALFFFLVWVYLAHLIFALSFGLKPLTNVMSSFDILLSAEGITMLIAGTIVGAGLAFLLFAVTVIAAPLLLDQDIDVVTAMITSFQTVMSNLPVMLGWAAVIAVLTAVAMVPLFLGMVVIFPILGHASWHLYRRAVQVEIREV